VSGTVASRRIPSSASAALSANGAGNARAKGKAKGKTKVRRDGTKSTNARQAAGASDDQQREPESRQRIINAAVHCIIEEGFYRASTNAIAERAGLSWGVIQYHFGSREALMLAVLEEGCQRLVEDLSTADIEGETLTERIESYYAILARYYAHPDYLAFVQVLLNLRHDPRTSEQTLETMSNIGEPVAAERKRLEKELFAGFAVRNRTVRGMVFNVLRGIALSEAMLGTLPFEHERLIKDLSAQRRLTAEALSQFIESGADTLQRAT
jgi:TetR/AcrR family transcriptional regulator, regulator of cefoperazone and chloramphenicol sensitivity